MIICRLEWGHTLSLCQSLVSKCTFGHFLLSMLYAFVARTFICSIYAIFYYIAMIPYANSVIASLQYANTVTAIFPLCQSSTLPFCSMMNLQHDSITIATEQGRGQKVCKKTYWGESKLRRSSVNKCNCFNKTKSI